MTVKKSLTLQETQNSCDSVCDSVRDSVPGDDSAETQSRDTAMEVENNESLPLVHNEVRTKISPPLIERFVGQYSSQNKCPTGSASNGSISKYSYR